MENVVFRERLVPGPVALALGVLAGAAVGAVVWPFQPVAGWVVGAVAAIAVVGALVGTAPLLVVTLGDAELGDAPTFHAGRARIDVEHLGQPEVLDVSAMREAMGPGAHARAYVCQRPWVDRGVRLTVTDERDPAPYWLVASRRPAELAEALEQAGQAAHSEQTSWPPSS